MTSGPEGKHIILTGFMGSGKSVVGALLAAEMGRRLIDVDNIVVGIAGMSIPRIFKDLGELHFRELETRALHEIFSEATPGSLVVATGGGTVVRAENRAILKENGIVIFLEVETGEVIRRVGADEGRPLLAGGDKLEKVKKMLAERDPLYRDCHFSLDTTGLDPQEVVGELKKLLQQKGA